MSDSHLSNARGIIARASTAQDSKKSPNLVLLAIDAANGMIDHAFDAHVLPLKQYACARWGTWQPHI